MYETIVVPTDGTEGADRGVDAGLRLAASTGAALHVLYVVDERRYDTPALGELELSIDRLEAQAQERLDEVRERATERDVAVTTAVRRGTPHETICEYASEQDADVIVMGRHGTSEDHVASTTDRVLRTAPVPVLTV